MLGRYRQTIRTWSDPVGRVLFRLHLRPNHLTLFGFGVSLLAAAAFIAGRTRWGGALLLVAGLFDLFDGSLARASGQVTPFGAFLDSVIDRYSDIVVLLGIVVFFARTPNARGAIVAMAGLAGSVMVSYTKARAESIGVKCNVGMMERPERLICLIVGALLHVLEPALWVLAILANVTALQRIAFTRRATRTAKIVAVAVALALLGTIPATAEPPAPARVGADTERAWAQAVAAYQQGDPLPAVREFSSDTALGGPIGDYLGLLLADALARKGDLAAARAAAAGVAERDPESRLAPRGLVLAAVLAARAGDEAGTQAVLKRLLERYPDAAEVPEALYLLGQATEARGDTETAALAYRQLMVLAPASGYADGAADRLAVLAAAGTAVQPLSLTQRIDRAERLLRGGVPKTAADEAERIASEARDPGIVLRALLVIAEGAQRIGRYDVAARTIEVAVRRAPAEQRPRLQLEHGRLLVRAGQREKALDVFRAVAAGHAQAEVSEALYQEGRTLDDLGRAREAARTFRTLAGRYPNREVAGASLWRLGWLAYLRDDLHAAARDWARLLEIPGGRPYRLGAQYWRARAVERLRGHAAADPLYVRVVTEAPRSYYGVLAAQRTRVTRVTTPAAPVHLPPDPDEAVAGDPGFRRVALLRRIGLVELAWDELGDVVQRSLGDPVRLYGASSAYVHDERYHMALRIFRRHFAGLAVTGDPALPRAFWEMLYPFGWRDDLTDAARRAGLDPYLVAAIVREESSYYPRALSPAGARGLMQLMPGTARPMAEHRGLAFAGGQMLDDPHANLEIGAAFFAGLLREFGDPRLAAAAYNAGPRRVRDWWRARRTDDVEAFVEQIPFDETRQYVKRVMLSWEEYRRLYAR